jgi:hypothetical protein
MAARRRSICFSSQSRRVRQGFFQGVEEFSVRAYNATRRPPTELWLVTRDGSTSCVKDIFRAAVEGDVECLEANLSIGVDINSLGQPTDVLGPRYEMSGLFYATPLHYACSYGREAAVRTLLQHGARTDIRSTSGLSCKEYISNYVSILMLLDSHERHD